MAILLTIIALVLVYRGRNIFDMHVLVVVVFDVAILRTSVAGVSARVAVAEVGALDIALTSKLWFYLLQLVLCPIC